MDAWSRKGVAWDLESSEDRKLTAKLVSRAYLSKWISKRSLQPLILHADNGNTMQAATLEVRLEELGVLRPFTRQWVSNENPYLMALFRKIKYRPDYPRKQFSSKEEACLCVVGFVDCYNRRHRHSGIKFVTFHKRHNG